jgi:competence protein ComEC
MVSGLGRISAIFDFSAIAKRPLVCGFLLFAGGIIYAYHTNAGFHALLYLASFLIIMAFMLRDAAKGVFFIMLSALIFLSGALSCVNFNTLPADNIYNILEYPEQQAHIKGTVRSLPAYTWQRWGNRQCSFLMKADSYRIDKSWFRVQGLLYVTISDNEREYDYGDSILIDGDIKKIGPAQAYSGQGYARYLNRQGIYTVIHARKDADIALIGKAGPLSLKRYIHRLRRGIERRFRRYLPYPDDAMLSAMLIGRRESIPKIIAEDFVHTGTIHILSVSGLHVGIISGILFIVLRLLKVPHKALSVIVILFLWFYVVMAGERIPILRTSIMISVYFISTIIDRDFDIYSALSLAGFLILLLNPMQVFDAGFQLSFSCVFFIVSLTPVMEEAFFRQRDIEKRPVVKKLISHTLLYLRKAFSSSLAVFAGIWPIIAFHFRIISPVTVIANIVVIPFLGIIISLGAILACIPEAFISAAPPVDHAVHLLFFMLFKAVNILSGLPFSFFDIKAVSLWVVFLYYIIAYIVFRQLLIHNMQASGKRNF